MPQLPINAKDVFLAALEITSPNQRIEFLGTACGSDAVLRKRVESLLAAHDEPDSRLDKPMLAQDETQNFRAIKEGPGTRVGPYKLLQQIGEGGMGVVYMAEQAKPVSRRVALKIIKPGMDSHQVVARFEAERQALAMMDHPNIAKVFDAGETDSGRPFFVMELVKGIPITKYCDEHRLTPKARLEIFVAVLYAIQHAHQKGIIHRDIKPTNVLVAEYDNQVMPKVIDFGVAKATNQKLTEKTMFTQFGQLVGTLEYMSPEQAKLNQADIDTRSDIYSLGVLLYELLTGETPFDRSKLGLAAFEEMLRVIREVEPPAPSTRLTSSASLASVSANRNMEPKRLSSLVRGELDWIVMKALDKERSRRYDTPSSFATDIQRYLNQEAVLARPVSTVYRMKKFTQRNRSLVGTIGAFAALLLFGASYSIWMAARANHARHDAIQAQQVAESERQNAERQRELAVSAATEEAKQKDEARRQEAKAIDAALSERAAKVAESQLRQTAEERGREIEQQNDQIVTLNTSLKQQQAVQRRTVYTSQLNLIQKAWDSNNFDRVSELLNASRPRPGEDDLRGFEWYYWQRMLYPVSSSVKLQGAPSDRNDSLVTELSQDGFQVANLEAVSEGWRLRVWDTRTGNLIFEKQLAQEPLFDNKPVQFQIPFLNTDTIAVVRVPLTTINLRVLASEVHPARTAEIQNSISDAKLNVYRMDTTEELISKTVPAWELQPVDKFVFSHNGARVAASLSSEEVLIWDTQSGDQIALVQAPAPNSINRIRGLSLALNADGSKVAIKPMEPLEVPGISIVNVNSNQIVTTQSVRGGHPRFSPDGARFVVRRTGWTMLDSETGEKLHDYETPPGQPIPSVVGFRFSPDGRWLAVQKENLNPALKLRPNGIELWNSVSGKREPMIPGRLSNIHVLGFNLDASQIMFLHSSSLILNWDFPGGKSSIDQNLQSPQTSDASLANTSWASADGRWNVHSQLDPVVSKSENVSSEDRANLNSVHLLTVEDTTHKSKSKTLRIANTPQMVLISPSGAYLVTVAEDTVNASARQAIVKVLEVASGNEVLSFRNKIVVPASRGARASAQRGLERGGLSVTPSVPAIRGARSPVQRGGVGFSIPPTALAQAVFSPDESRLAVVFTADAETNPPLGARLQLWNLTTGKELFPNDRLPKVRSQVRFSDSGRMLLDVRNRVLGSTQRGGLGPNAAGRGQSNLPALAQDVQVWDSADGKLLWEHGIIGDAIVASDGESVASIIDSKDTQVSSKSFVVWKAATGQQICDIPGEFDPLVTQYAIAQGANRVAIANGPNAIICDTETGRPLATLLGHEREIAFLAFSSDGRRLASIAGDRRVTRTPVRAWIGNNVDFPASFSNVEAKVWDVSTGHELLSLNEPTTVPAASGQFRGGAIELTSHQLRAADRVWDGAPIPMDLELDELLRPCYSLVSQSHKTDEDYDAALRNLENACLLAPENSEAWRLRAVIHFHLRQFAESLVASKRSLALDSNPGGSQLSEHLTIEAMELFRSGKRDDAIARLDVARISVSQNEQNWQSMLEFAERMIRIPKASDEPAQWLDRSFMPRIGTSLVPINRTMPTMALGEVRAVYLRSNSVLQDRIVADRASFRRTDVVPIEHAIQYYTGHLVRNPNDTDAYVLRGFAREYYGEVDLAIEDFSAALHRHRTAELLAARGDLWLNCKHEYSKAAVDFEEALRLAPRDPRTHVSLGEIYQFQRRFEDSLNSIDEAIGLDPLSGSNYIFRATTWAAKNDRIKMIQDIEEGARLSPGDARVWNSRAWLLATVPNSELRDGKQAVADATKACELSNWIQPIYLDTLAAAYAETGDFDKAVEWQKQAIVLGSPGKRLEFESRLKLFQEGKPYYQGLTDAVSRDSTGTDDALK